MGESPDQIREEIASKRQDAAGKIDQLSNQVQGTAEQLRDQATNTAGLMRNEVKGAVDDTIATAKENLDIRQQIEDRPLVALGVAFAGGILLGGMTGGGKGHSGGSQASSGQGQSSGGRSGGLVQAAFKQSGLEETLSNASAALMGTVTEQLRTTLDRTFPGFGEKLQTAQAQDGGLAEKSRATQATAQS